MLILFFFFILIASIALALAEIQIEGEYGWAKKLPTWRETIRFGKFKFEITGYHVFFFLTIFILLHFRFVFQPFSLKDELFNISAYLFITVLEDFFWFLFNPHYGLKRYNKENVYWYKTWISGVPIIYFIVTPLAVIFLLIALSL